jgi:hypothetical protein
MKHLRRNSMTNRFMMSVAAVALIAGAGFANAQGTGTNREQPSAGSTAQQSQGAPSSERGNSAAPTSPSSGMKATQSDEKSPGAVKNQRAEDKDKAQGSKSKSMSSESEGAKGGKDMKAEGRNGNMNSKMNAEQKGAADSKSQTTQTGQTNPQSQTGQTTTQSQSGTSVQSQTTGQAGASAKLSSEQRTKIVSTIREQHVQPVTNVNFEIRPGVRVSRDVRFYPLPREVVTIYPEWRGYEFILVNDKIVVINPRTLEIVDVLEA